MKPIMQTKFGTDWNDPSTAGDCMSACIASVLELSLEDVPNFMEAGEEGWWDAMQVWLGLRGFAYVEINATGLPSLSRPEIGIPDDQVYFVVGISPRETPHVVLYKGNKLAHDPNPAGTGLVRGSVLGFLVPLCPAKAYEHRRVAMGFVSSEASRERARIDTEEEAKTQWADDEDRCPDCGGPLDYNKACPYWSESTEPHCLCLACREPLVNGFCYNSRCGELKEQ